MKLKNIIYILPVIVFTCFIPTKVKGLSYETNSCAADVSMYTVASSVNIGALGRNNRPIYYMTVHDQTALCMDGRLHMRNGTPVYGTPNDTSASTIVKKAVAYCASAGCSSGGTGALNFLAAQVSIWNGGVSVSVLEQAYCGYKHINCSRLVNLAAANAAMAPRAAALSGITPASSITIWRTESSGYQPLATMPDSTCQILCPEGTANAGTDITDCVASGRTEEQCIARYCGTPATCSGVAIVQSGDMGTCTDDNYTSTMTFTEVIGSAASPAAGSPNGERERLIGTYCSLYCLETAADVTLPGGLSTAISVGSSLVWPTSSKNASSKFENMYPIKFQGTKKCKIQVAPNLTYDTMCQVDPVQLYNTARTNLITAYDKNHDAKAAADAANAYLDEGGTLTKVDPTDKLNWNNEEIRQYSAKCLLDPGVGGTGYENCADDAYFVDGLKYHTIGADNKRISASTYNSTWRAWVAANPTYTGSDDGTECTENYSTCPLTGSCCKTSKTVYKCEYGGGHKTDRFDSTCTTDETSANHFDANTKWWHNAKDKWSKYYDSINLKYTLFKDYALKYSILVEIYRDVKDCADFTFSCDGESCDLYNFETSADVKYEDEGNEYGTTYSLVKANELQYSCNGCSSVIEMFTALNMYKNTYTWLMDNPTVDYLQGKIDEIELKDIIMNTNEIEYTLPEDLYYYLNKNTGKYVHSKPSTDNYIYLGYSNLPTSFNNKVGKKYNLIIDNITLGDNGVFNSENRNLSWLDYICHYTVANSDDECFCPPGTKNAGTDIYYAMIHDGISCADAKEKYCDENHIPECTVDCDKYCPNDQSIKITGCVNSGMSVAECERLLCYGSTYTCTNSNDNDPRNKMDITSCVAAKRAQGYSLTEAIKYCDEVVCPLKNIIIYRTISLSNPFPSKDADTTVKQSGLRIGMFNDTIKGRFPGYNWNGVATVKTKILNNRDTDGDSVYNKEPLYTIVLNTKTILDIRAYNDRQSQYDKGYSDFTLDCVKPAEDSSNIGYSGTMCFSKFLRETNSGLTGGTCKTATSWGALRDCLS